MPPSNNVFASAVGEPFNLIRTVEAEWRNGRAISGTNNWIQGGSTIPPELSATLQGADPGFVDLAALDLRPASTSTLIESGNPAPPVWAAHPFPDPLWPPAAHPPTRTVADSVLPRFAVGPIDIGAYEFGTPPELRERLLLPILRR